MTESSAASPTMIASEQDDPLAKVRAQFDRAPYPRVPLDRIPSATHLYRHDFRTAYYRRNQKIASTEGRVMLDVGCGSGYGVLTMVLANPGARIVGVDLSPASVELAKQRLDHHGLGDRVEFHALAMEELPKLGTSFDYINCDELLYLQPDPSEGLAAMKAVLKSEGIIRTNFHSFYQRIDYFKAQDLSRLVGLMDDNPGEMEIEVLQSLIESIKDDVQLKPKIWNCVKSENEEKILMNVLFQQDRGFTVPQLFGFLEKANLEFISMVDWQSWDINELFKDPEEIPLPIALGLSETSTADQLHFYDLLQSNHRLLDFFSGHPQVVSKSLPIAEWEAEQWDTATITLHPQLQTQEFTQYLRESISQCKLLDMNQQLQFSWGLGAVSDAMAAGLLPLCNGPSTLSELARCWKEFRPYDPVTLESVQESDLKAALRYLITEFVQAGYLLAEA